MPSSYKIQQWVRHFSRNVPMNLGQNIQGQNIHGQNIQTKISMDKISKFIRFSEN
jgi:hypothetical protein